MNKGIPDIFSSRGIKTFYHDMLQYSEEDVKEIEPLLNEIHWHYAAGILEAAEVLAKTANLYPVLITSFHCSPDSFLIDYFKRIMDNQKKPYLILQLDDHGSNVGYETRIEAAIRSFRNHRIIATKNIGNAVLSVNAVPIVYQARFREQQMQHVRNEIETLIAQIEQGGSALQPSDVAADLNVEARLLKEFIPNMLYCRKEKAQFTTAQQQLRTFLRGYRFPDDIEAIINLISMNETFHDHEDKLLELYAKKIAAVAKEDFSAADKHSASIQQLLGTTPPRQEQ